MTGEPTLESLRREIDAVDDAIDELIIRRTQLVEEVRVIKRGWPIKIQPSREAAMIRRLLERHRGPFPKRDLVAIWRQLIVATLSFEGPFAVAVLVAPGKQAYWDLARDHFGMFAPMHRETTVADVLARVTAQDATVGVIPVPDAGAGQPWWHALADNRPGTPKVIARLPFVGPGNAWTGGREALVVCPIRMVATGCDRSYVVAEAAQPIGEDRLKDALTAAQFELVMATPWSRTGASGRYAALIEVEGFVALTDDPRMAPFAAPTSDQAVALTPIGGYALPLTAAELQSDVRSATGGAAAVDCGE
ncbi:MAG: chorismate mutase [Defluviicoccus sp.]|nr:chorismate mutase [Defluviicoccus sp.]MDG4591644.1 chorismate mutase [Defluviicoccus sp.]